jgi:hypothetical protein
VSSSKQGSWDSPQKDTGVLPRALRQAIGCCYDGKDVSGGRRGGDKKVTRDGHWGAPSVGRCGHRSRNLSQWDMLGPGCLRAKHRVKGAKSPTGWCWGLCWDGSWPRSQVRREAGARGGSERAGGALRRSGEKRRSRGCKWGAPMLPSPALPSCFWRTQIELAHHPA